MIDFDDENRELETLMKTFADQVNAWLERHDRDEHDGEPCERERGNILAYLAHRMGYTHITLLQMVRRLEDYFREHQKTERTPS